MANSKWIYRKVDSVFLRGGFYDPPFDALVEGLVEFPDADPHPDPRLNRFDPVVGKRLATADELLAYDAAIVAASATRDIDEQKAIKAAVICSLWGRLARQPTTAEISAERTRFINIYKAL